MDNQRLKTYLGFALRARLCTKGTDAVLSNIRAKKADVVILENDASENTKKQIRNACSSHGITLLESEDNVLFQITKENYKVISVKTSTLSEQIKQLQTFAGV